MQRREQQRRAAAGGPASGSYLGGGISGYSPVPQREFSAPTPVRTASPAPSSLRAPAFKGSGMKLGAKKTQQAALLDALAALQARLAPDVSGPYALGAWSLLRRRPAHQQAVDPTPSGRRSRS